MKKTVSLLLAAVLLLGVLNFSAFAAGGKLTVRNAAAPVRPGDSFSMDVVISDNPGIAALILDVDYDHTALRLDSAVGVLTSGTWDIADINENDVLMWYNYANVSTNGTLARLRFTVLDSAAAGEYTVSLKTPTDDWRGIYNDTDSSALTFSYVGGKVTVKGQAPEVTGSLSVASVSANPGATVEVPLYIEDNPGLIGMEFRVEYDSAVLEWIGVEAGDFGEKGGYELKVGEPLSWFASDERTDVALNGLFATLRFRVNEEAEDGDTTVTIVYDEDDVFNADFDNVAFDVTPGTVTIKSHTPGDINGDGKVNNKDYMALRRYIKYKDIAVVEAALDINADGKVNNKDYMALRRFIKYSDIVIY